MQRIFLHGLGQTPSSFDKMVSFLPEPEKIRRPSLPSLLERQEKTYANLYKAFSGICQDIPEPLHLCGLSLGGILALHYTIGHPEKVRSIVLIGAQYKMPKKLLKIQNILFRLMPQSAFRDMGFQKQDFIKLANSMQDLDFTSKLQEVSCPALIVCGEKDRANQKAASELAHRIKGAAACRIQGAGQDRKSVV